MTNIINRFHLAWLLFKDQRVPLWAKSVPLLSFLYVISPIDFLPDIWPALGQLDDVGVIILGLTLFVKLCPPEVVAGHAHDLEHGSKGAEVIDATYRVVND